MSQPANIADRHERQVPGLKNGGGMTVRILTGPLTRQADQLLLICLLNLLCRMAGTVKAIEIDAPDVILELPLPDGSGPGFVFDRLAAFSRWAVGDVVSVLRRRAFAADLTISIGALSSEDNIDLFVTGAGWIAWVGIEEPETELADGPNPIGPWFAASLAAGEVFKRARGLTRGRYAREDEGYGLWDGSSGPLRAMADGPPLGGRSLPPFYLVGAGAVGQGIIALLGVGRLPTFVVTIDDDTHDETNLNRCFVAGMEDIGDSKTNAVTRYRTIAGISGAEFQGTLQQFVKNGPLDEMPSALRASQAEDCFEIIISAVDKNTSRRDVQGLQPRLVIGGSTDHLTAKAMTYGAFDGVPCLACHNPPEEKGADRRALEQQIRGLDDSEARLILSPLGIEPAEIEAVMDYVRTSPICGSVGDRVLGDLAANSPSEFSVSFVSMAAAVLALVRLLQATCFVAEAPARRVMSSVALRNLSYSDDGLSRDPSCPLC